MPNENENTIPAFDAFDFMAAVYNSVKDKEPIKRIEFDELNKENDRTNRRRTTSDNQSSRNL